MNRLGSCVIRLNTCRNHPQLYARKRWAYAHYPGAYQSKPFAYENYSRACGFKP